MNKWKKNQQYRLALEKKILERNMPDFHFYEPMKDTYVYGKWTSSVENTYGIMIVIPDAFPEECPSCYITEPAPLMSRQGPLNEFQNNHEMHVWKTDITEYTMVCTYKPANWSAAHSLEKVIQKALLWIEAYEAHMITGDSIADFLVTVKH